MSRVVSVPGCTDAGALGDRAAAGGGAQCLPPGLDEIQPHALERIRVLFFDQLLDNLGVGVDDWRNKAVRDALHPLRSIARELGVAVIGCLHPNKRADSFRQLVAGAPAFNAVSRSSWASGSCGSRPGQTWR